MVNAFISAREIAEDLLERTGTAMVAGDFPGFAECFHFPQDLDTFDGNITITSPTELKHVFFQVLECYQSLGVTNMVRHVVAAEFRGPAEIMSTHESRLFSGAALIKEPYVVLSVLKRKDGLWKIFRSQYAIADMPRLNTALLNKNPGRAPANLQRDPSTEGEGD